MKHDFYRRAFVDTLTAPDRPRLQACCVPDDRRHCYTEPSVHAFLSAKFTARYRLHVPQPSLSPLFSSAAARQGFDSSGPIGALTSVTLAEGGAVSASAGLLEDEGARKIWLEVDGVKRQDSMLGEMVWSVPEMIARLSEVI